MGKECTIHLCIALTGYNMIRIFMNNTIGLVTPNHDLLFIFMTILVQLYPCPVGSHDVVALRYK